MAAPASAGLGADRDVVKVNGTPIRQSEVLERLWQLHGPETLDQMINELILRQAVQARHIKVEPKEIDARVAKLREGLPDPKLLDQKLQQEGSSLEEFKKDLGEQLAQEKLVVEQRKLSVTDAELKEAFAAHKNELGTPEAVHLRHLSVATKEEADAVFAQVKGGADFADVARAKSISPMDKLNGGDYGWMARGMLPPEVEQMIFAMQPGELRIVPSASGIQVLQALERRKGVPPTFEKVKNELREFVLREKVRAAMPAFMKELREKAEIQPQGA